MAILMRILEALELNNQNAQKPTPNTLESLKYSQTVSEGIDPATLAQEEIAVKVNALYQNTHFFIIVRSMSRIQTHTTQVAKII